MRLIRHERRQQLAVLGLIAVALAVASFGAALTANTTAPPTRTGTATHVLLIRASERADPHASERSLDELLAVVDNTVGRMDVVALRPDLVLKGTTQRYDLSDASTGGQFGQSMLTVVEGRMPAALGEVAITELLGRRANLELGDVWEIDVPGRGARSVRVSGIVEDPLDLNHALAVVPRGSVPSPTLALAITRTRDAAVDLLPDLISPATMEITSIAAVNAHRNTEVLYIVLLSTIGMFEVGLLCSAGFAVMARRRLRELALLGALGSRTRDLQRAMVANGAVLGAVGGGLGICVGFGSSLAVRPVFESWRGYRLEPWRIPWSAVFPFVVLAVATAAITAWLPARTAARTPIVAGLQSRRPVPRPVRRGVLVGILLAVVGPILLYHGARNGSALPAAGGMFAGLCGILAITPAAIAALGRFGGHLPLAVRIAARDLARNQARSAAALAALVVAFAMPLGIAISGASVDANAKNEPLNVATDTAFIWHRLPGGVANPPPTSFEPSTVNADLSALKSVVPGATLSAIQMLVDPRSEAVAVVMSNGESFDTPAVLRWSQRNESANAGENSFAALREPVWAATPELLRAWGINEAVAHSNTLLLGRSPASVLLGAESPEAAEGVESVQPTVLPDLPNLSSAAQYWMPIDRAQALGYVPITVGWVIRSPVSISDPQRIALGRSSGQHLVVETTASAESTGRLRALAWVGGTAVAISILLIALSLLRAESGADHAVLAAVGAPIRVRPHVTAATATMLAATAMVFAVPVGYLTLVALMANPSHAYPFVVPWATILTAVLAIPVLAAAGGWLAGIELRGRSVHW